MQMKTFKIVARDSFQALETYVIEANTCACAIKKIKQMWKDTGFKHPNHIMFTWSEVAGNKPQPPKVTTPSKPRVIAPPAAGEQEDYVLTPKVQDPSPSVNEHSGIFTDIEGSTIELALVPKEEY